jgi:hypothetical protein
MIRNEKNSFLVHTVVLIKHWSRDPILSCKLCPCVLSSHLLICQYLTWMIMANRRRRVEVSRSSLQNQTFSSKATRSPAWRCSFLLNRGHTTYGIVDVSWEGSWIAVVVVQQFLVGQPTKATVFLYHCFTCWRIGNCNLITKLTGKGLPWILNKGKKGKAGILPKGIFLSCSGETRSVRPKQ